jgi:hypothetical protein
MRAENMRINGVFRVGFVTFVRLLNLTRAPNRPFNGTAVTKMAVFWPRAGLPVRRWKFQERLTDGFRPSNPSRPFRRVINFLFGTLAWQ